MPPTSRNAGGGRKACTPRATRPPIPRRTRLETRLKPDSALAAAHSEQEAAASAVDAAASADLAQSPTEVGPATSERLGFVRIGQASALTNRPHLHRARHPGYARRARLCSRHPPALIRRHPTPLRAPTRPRVLPLRTGQTWPLFSASLTPCPLPAPAAVRTLPTRRSALTEKTPN